MYVDPHDDEYYKERLLALFSKQECIRSQIYRAFGAKIKAEQLTRVLESLAAENKISCRRLGFYETGHHNYPEAWGLYDHPAHVRIREEKERDKLAMLARQQEYRAAKLAKEARQHWRDFCDEAMVINAPEDVFAKLHRWLLRSQQSPARRKEQITEPWFHSISLLP